MPGFQKRRAMWAKLDTYGEERVIEDLMGGLKVRELCEVMDISSPMFYAWLKQSPERQRVYREMRQATADGLLDEMLEIADGSTMATIGVDRERIKIRQWLAERWNREEYGQSPAAGAGLVFNVGELHLTALKSSRTGELPAGDAVEVEGENVA